MISVVMVQRICARFIALICIIYTLSIGIIDIDLSVSVAIIVNLILIELHISS